MKILLKIFNKFAKATAVVAIGIMAIALHGCADADLLPTPDSGNGEELRGAEIGIEVTIPVFGDSRTPAGSYDDGRLTQYENFLDIDLNAEKKNFRVYFFTSDNLFIEEFVPTEFVEHDSQASSFNAKIYTLRGNLTTNLGPNFKIVLLANWGIDNYPTLVWTKDENGVTTERSTIADLSKIVSDQAYKFSAPLNLGPEDSQQYIPMFGIKTCTDRSFMDGMLTWCGSIHLLRAVAKIEVIEADLSLDAIQDVRLRNYNAFGICAPTGVTDENDYIKNDYASDYVSHLTLLDGSNDSDEKYSNLTNVPGTKKWIIYVPEYQNLNLLGPGDAGYDPNKIGYNPKSVRDDSCWLEVDMQNKAEASQKGTYKVLFKYYTQGIANSNGCQIDDHFNIQRNYDYRFTVTRGTEFEIIAEVLPYISVDLKPIFGITRDPEGRIVDIHGRLIDYQGNLIQENEDGKLYLTSPLFELKSYLPEIGSLINDHNEPVDELGRRIHKSGWLINDYGSWNLNYNPDLNDYIIDASGENATISFEESNKLGYLSNASNIIDNYGNTLTLNEITHTTTRDDVNKPCDRWGHLIAEDTEGNFYLVNAKGEQVDIYLRPIKVLTLTIGEKSIERSYLIDSSSNYIDSKGNRITVNETTGVMCDSFGRTIDKNSRTIYNYDDPGALGLVGDGHTYYVKYFGLDEVTITDSNRDEYTLVTVKDVQYYIRRVNKFNEFVDSEYRRINENGDLIDSEGNIISPTTL